MNKKNNNMHKKDYGPEEAKEFSPSELVDSFFQKIVHLPLDKQNQILNELCGS